MLELLKKLFKGMFGNYGTTLAPKNVNISKGRTEVVDLANKICDEKIPYLSGSKGNVLGTSESTKGTKKDVNYPSITLYDPEGYTIGRCDSITGSTTSGVHDIMYLHGVHLHEDKNIDELDKVEIILSSTDLKEYLVLTSTKLSSSENSFKCVMLSRTE